MLFYSCEKETDVTDIEVIENQLKDFVRKNEITKCSINLMSKKDVLIEYNNAEFTISKGFVVIVDNYGNGQSRYNLLYLSKYKLDRYNRFELYFTNMR